MRISIAMSGRAPIARMTGQMKEAEPGKAAEQAAGEDQTVGKVSLHVAVAVVL